MLLSMEVDLIPKKPGYKRNLVWPSGSYSSKMVFILLTNVVTFYVRSTTIDIWGFGPEIFSRSTF